MSKCVPVGVTSKNAIGAPKVTPTGTHLLITVFKLLTIGVNKLVMIRVELMTE